MIFAAIAVLIVAVLAFILYRQTPKNTSSNANVIANDNQSEKLEVENNPSSTDNTNTMDLAKPDLTIDSTKKYTAMLETTEGTIKIQLHADKTPITSNNFVYLARNKFYDGTIFHRVIDGFMIQGGDPTGTGSGGPGYKFDDEPFDGEYTRGTVAMANAGPDTNGSQFFIMHADNPLPKNYVIFGEVIEGMEVVDKIATAETTISLGGEASKPVNPVKINTVEIIEE